MNARGLCAATLIVVALVVTANTRARAQDVMALWPTDSTESAVDAGALSLTVYLPPEASRNGTAVLVCPGGGYGGLAVEHEGEDVAEWLNEHGITGFVLRYRHAPAHHHPAPLDDAQRAIQLVRSRASEWGINTGRIGILGFSAGGHLSATASTRWLEADRQAEDPARRVSSRPDFAVLLYPVITLTGPHAHTGSRTNLLGEGAPQEMVEALSAERQVTEATPPAFIAHTTEDAGVPVQNALLYYAALVEHKVPAELHVFQKGRHGLGLGPAGSPFAEWPGLCLKWLAEIGMLEPAVPGP